jgi:hypothetical protein
VADVEEPKVDLRWEIATEIADFQDSAYGYRMGMQDALRVADLLLGSETLQDLLRKHDAQVGAEAVKRFVNEQSVRYRKHSGRAVVEDYALAVELFGIDPDAEDTGWGEAMREETNRG